MKAHRLNRIRIAIIDDMRRLRKLPFSVNNVYRYDLLQRRLDKCNLKLWLINSGTKHSPVPLCTSTTESLSNNILEQLQMHNSDLSPSNEQQQALNIADVMRSLPVAEILALDQPWPLRDVLNKLIEASEILLHDRSYDGHGWEEISYAVGRAKQIVGLFGGNDASGLVAVGDL